MRIDCICDQKTEINPYAHWEQEQPQNQPFVENLQTLTQPCEIKSIRAKIVIAADGINSIN